MTQRQEKILAIIVETYIKKAMPTASEYLSKKFIPKLSSATIRNEMVKLTDTGYLFQYYASAGRVPTNKGFQYYIKNLLDRQDLLPLEKKILVNIKRENELPSILAKQVAKQMAKFAQELSVLALDYNNFYYTGLSYLLSQPEFNQPEAVYNISRVIDNLDEIMSNIFDSVEGQTKVLIGRKNPFGNLCGAIITKCQLSKRKNHILFGILGPARMDYNKNIALVNYVKKLLSND